MTTGAKIGIGVGVLALIGVGVYFLTKGKKTVVVPQPQLSWIDSKELSDWLQSKFEKDELITLRGWLDLIKRERANDSTRWKKDEDFATQQISDVAGALYQMKQAGQKGGVWDIATKFELKDMQ